MYIKTNYKTAMFYGHTLQVKGHVSYIAANDNGEIHAFLGEPTRIASRKVWHGSAITRIDATVSFNPGESWEDTLTYCEEDGQDWMLSLKTKIAVEQALLLNGAILREKALHNVMDALPSGVLFTSRQWNAFYKHSGVVNVAGKDFLAALAVKIRQMAMRYIEAEKCERIEDDSLLVRDYYGAELVIPAWARFIAMDSDGPVWGYEERPDMDTDADGEWSTDGRGKVRNVGWRSNKIAGKEWRDSLREVRR
mgnify:CR=1 FL=1|jgi:hypothetical protein|nr:MAG TPA: hypothetical protein [Caudoviricetes sp.]